MIQAIWSGSYAFSKSSLNIWKFLFHLLLKPSLENFEPSLRGFESITLLAYEMNAIVR